jgi:hypothetical protein
MHRLDPRLCPECGENDREKLASWMVANGFATGHGDTIEDLLRELTWQVEELRGRLVPQGTIGGDNEG